MSRFGYINYPCKREIITLNKAFKFPNSIKITSQPSALAQMTDKKKLKLYYCNVTILLISILQILSVFLAFLSQCLKLLSHCSKSNTMSQVTIGLNSPTDLFYLSDEDQALRHTRRIVTVVVHKNYKRASPYDIGMST